MKFTNQTALLTGILALQLGPFAVGGLAAIMPGEYIANDGNSVLTIKEERGHLHFILLAESASHNACDLSGTILNDQGKLSHEDPKRPCSISFQANGARIKLSDLSGAACWSYCGQGASFEDDYVRAPPECTRAQVAAARRQFKTHYDLRDYPTARAVLEPVVKTCEDFIPYDDRGMLRNDLALTQFKLGDFSACLSTLDRYRNDAAKSDDDIREETAPPAIDATLKTIHAARTNIRLCRMGTKQK